MDGERLPLPIYTMIYDIVEQNPMSTWVSAVKKGSRYQRHDVLQKPAGVELRRVDVQPVDDLLPLVLKPRRP